MKITNKPKLNQVTFPVLMENVTNNSVFLFINNVTGVVVVAKSNGYEVGHTYNNLISCHDRTNWRVYTGEITLSND
jgi:hypothetical protein